MNAAPAARPRIARSTAVHRGAAAAVADTGRPPEARRARGCAEDTELLLLKSAEEAFGRKGYIRTTVQDIIEGTGFSRGAFYRYFASTDDCFVTVITRMIDELVASSRERTGRTLRERVYDGNLRYMQVFARHRGLMRAMFEAAFVNPDITVLQARMRSAYLRRVRDHLARMVLRGQCQPIDVNAATLALGMMVEGAAQAWVVMGLEPFEHPLDMERLCHQVTEIWCRSIYLDAELPQPDGRGEPAEANDLETDR